MRNREKRADIFHKAKEEHINILCLQEKHITNDDINTIKEDCSVTFYISGRETNAGGGGGVLIALDNNFEYNVHDSILDSHGRYVMLDIELIGVASFILINMYAPNEDDPNFFVNMFNIIENLDTQNLILVGDWNSVIDYEIDTFNYLTIRKRIT